MKLGYLMMLALKSAKTFAEILVNHHLDGKSRFDQVFHSETLIFRLQIICGRVQNITSRIKKRVTRADSYVFHYAPC